MLQRALISIFTLLSFVGCKSASNSGTQPIDGPAAWKVDMHQMSASLANLLPLSADPLQFNNPSNQPQIEQEIARLAHFSHAIGQMKDKPAADPSMEFMAKEFNAEMTEAQRQLRLGNRSYSRFLIRNATNYCISCHTQTNRGPQFNLATNPFVARMTPLERANYLFAVRGFDQGLKEFEAAMQGPDVALLPYASVEEVTLKALAVAVRVKQDPRMAEQIVERILHSKWAPVYLQLSAVGWKSSIQDWRKAPKGKTLTDARALLTKGWSRQVELPMSRAGLIEFLRASVLLHDLLDKKTGDKSYAEILYSAGLASEALKELDLYSLSGFYFENCIRKAPHTMTSRSCYVRLETVELSNYAAFDGVGVPSHVRERLDQLRSLALPIGKSWVE